jgi:hypothetical protein
MVCDAVGFLLVRVSRPIDGEFGLDRCGCGGMQGDAAEVPAKARGWPVEGLIWAIFGSAGIARRVCGRIGDRRTAIRGAISAKTGIAPCRLSWRNFAPCRLPNLLCSKRSHSVISNSLADLRPYVQ